MKIFLPALFFCPLLSIAQQTINGSIMHDGIERTYILYVPASYSPSMAAPLLFNFHGYTSSAVEQMFYGDFRPIADTAGFLIVHPQGTTDQFGNPHWNVGWGLSNVDDVGFTAALMDTIASEYHINADRIYSTGMSNGGFFSYLLGCTLSDRIAAIASVTGSMSISLPNTCSPSHPVPVMEIHGTADETVPYEGNFISTPIPEVLSFWAEENNTDPTPVITDVPDINPNDNSTAEHYLYANGDNGSTVEHYKIIGGGHTWPGAIVDIGVTNHDIDASNEIWRFFSKYDINGLITISSTHSIETGRVNVYPNPANQWITIEAPSSTGTSFAIHGMNGNRIMEGRITSGRQQVYLGDLPAGVYMLTVGDQRLRMVRQ